MTIFKCKICGGSLEIDNAQSVATCEYCGTKQTLPKLDNERRANLYDRANHFRRNNDFDKAMGIYENILNEDITDAEAYWSLVLCRYGIEYVEDPATHKRVPTVNRAQFTSIFDDEDYKSAIANADGYQRELYEAEANAINEIQKEILSISQKEEPFDVFICYKENDAYGKRTPDSVLATELYHELVREGFKVFFARITLEDKLGVAYEPYIFAAIHSAKVMVVLGTRPEHFNAVWVKNEWNRYLALIKNGAKKTLIPAYRDMDPYDLPEEFSHLQAQDMSKLGFMQDLTRGIKKIVETDTPKITVKETIVATATTLNVAPLLKRAFMFLEDGDFERADDFCEQALNQDAENAQAYLGKLMVELRVKRQADLAECTSPFDDSKNYQKAVRFADPKLAGELKNYIAAIKDRNSKEREEARKEAVYAKAMEDYESNDVIKLQSAIKRFSSLNGYEESEKHISLCNKKIDELLQKKKRKQAKLKRTTAVLLITGLIISLVVFLITWIPKNWNYKIAVALMNEDCYEEALLTFEKISGFRDSNERIITCKKIIVEQKYTVALDLMNARKYMEAKPIFEMLDEYQNSKDLLLECNYNIALGFMSDAQHEKAKKAFEELGDYKNSSKLLLECKYNIAYGLMSNGQYGEAKASFSALGDYENSPEMVLECEYSVASDLMKKSAYRDALSAFMKIVDYKDSRNNIVAMHNFLNNSIATGASHTVGLNQDGTVEAVGRRSSGQLELNSWKNIVAVDANMNYTVGLKADSTIVKCGHFGYDTDTSTWTNIVSISAGERSLVGLKANGRVVATGNTGFGQCNTSGWNNIIAVEAGSYYTLGLKADGTVVATGDDSYGWINVDGWRDIVAIDTGAEHTVGLKSNGRVVAVGKNDKGQCNVSSWRDIVAISAGDNFTVGLKSNGTIVMTGPISCDVSDWKDIVAISMGGSHIVGLKSDGTVVAKITGNYVNSGQSNVSNWKNIGAPVQ